MDYRVQNKRDTEVYNINPEESKYICRGPKYII